MFESDFTKACFESGWQPKHDYQSIPQESISQFKAIYFCMLQSRLIDQLESKIISRGQAFFHVASAGHESMAVLNNYLHEHDWLYCHYRDRALLLSRGIKPEVFFHALYANDKSPSKGRQMNAHISDASRNLLSIPGPVGNHALHAVGIGLEIKSQQDCPIVLCAMGDGSSQQGEVLEAIAEAIRWHSPVLFLIENNALSISTQTSGKTFFSLPGGQPDSFYGLPIHRLDGRDAVKCWQSLGQIVADMRLTRSPALVVIDMPRLSNHSNADDQRVYRQSEELDRQSKEDDPLMWLTVALKEADVTRQELTELSNKAFTQVEQADHVASHGEDPESVYDVMPALPRTWKKKNSEYLGNPNETDRFTMVEAIREVLRQRMMNDPRVSLYGEDIEDPKGDVFGLTRGLSSAYPGRVNNSPLAEASIVGVSIGRALAGGRPVGFIQFADFLPIALNQIISELATMYWRTDGSWRCPVILMITCGGYRPGLGPFHAQSFESIAAHTPGIDVVMPSSAADAAGLLNAAFISERPTLFFYPKSCLNDRYSTTSVSDIDKQFAIPGRGRLLKTGNALTLVSWGNGLSRCLQVAKDLSESQYHYECDVIDLRSLSPWDEDLVIKSAARTGRLLVVHEDNRSCGMGAEVIATVAEKASCSIRVGRVVREDIHIPYNFSNQLEVLPSYQRIFIAAAKLLDCDVIWDKEDADLQNQIIEVDAIGNSPSDESVVVSEWNVKPGTHVAVGDLVAALESDKVIGEILSAYQGEVTALLAKEGDMIEVGAPLYRIRIAPDSIARKKPVTKASSTTPAIQHRIKQRSSPVVPGLLTRKNTPEPMLIGIDISLGERIVDNMELAERWPNRTAAEIKRLTGIERRHYVSSGQSVKELAIAAVQKVLARSEINIEQLDLVICTTATPDVTTPSLACQVVADLSEKAVECPCYDISAACAGYLYGLRSVYDYLQSNGSGSALLITSEVLSPLLDVDDFNTSIIFGDAATATLIQAESSQVKKGLRLKKPFISANGNGVDAITVPVSGDPLSNISMSGSKVFSQGVKKMSEALQTACFQQDVGLAELDMIITHQANQRMIHAIANRLNLEPHLFYSNLSRYGNTSSNSIPLCLNDVWDELETGNRVGLTALGGGIVFGATVLETQGVNSGKDES